jgi:hypothetical protein
MRSQLEVSNIKISIGTTRRNDNRTIIFPDSHGPAHIFALDSIIRIAAIGEPVNIRVIEFAIRVSTRPV